MLQFLTHKSDRYSIAEEAQMAIEGGCQWIQVTHSVDNDASLKEILLEIKPMCEESGAFLVVDDDIELCNELRIHGVHLSKGGVSPAKAREELGPHAVIGVDVESADDIMALEGKDIDYAVLATFGKNLTFDDIKRIIDDVRAKGSKMNIVARGFISEIDIKPLIDAGVNGIAISDTIIDAEDPVEETKRIISILMP